LSSFPQLSHLKIVHMLTHMPVLVRGKKTVNAIVESAKAMTVHMLARSVARKNALAGKVSKLLQIVQSQKKKAAINT
jgi:hypothetical protein